MRFVGYDELGDEPNIVVDGAANSATLITLSHWPHSGTPRALKADSSTEIVFKYLDAPDFHVAAEVASNNHFDEDGLAGLYALIEPEAANRMRGLLNDLSHAGDFATYRDRRAARIAFTISAFVDRAVSPLDTAIFDRPYPEQCASLYRALLPRLHEMATDIERFENYWRDEDRALDDSEAALRTGAVTIEEMADIDLAVVTVPEGWAAGPAHRFTQPEAAPCHPMAVHNATRCNRILTIQGRRYDVLYRYESWVQYMTHPPPARVDLGTLAERLTTEESAGEWHFDGIAALTPRMTLQGAEQSNISPESFREKLVAYLDAAPPAWDPYDP